MTSRFCIPSTATVGVVLLSLASALSFNSCGNDAKKNGGSGSGGSEPSATGNIGPDGGAVSITSPSGVKFNLSVPAGASEPATVTVTALRGVEGFALARHVLAALRLAPEGLQFAQPATLTVTPASGASFPPNTLAFLLSNGQADPLPASVKNGAVEVPIAHFSEVAIMDPAAAAEAGQVAQSRYDAFMEWTKAFLERNFDYFARPEAAFHHVPTCADAWSIINIGLGLCRLSDVVGDSRCNEVLGRLMEVLGVMVDGFGGANQACADTGDDSLVLQCAAAASRLAEIAGVEFWVNQRCGATRIVATPDQVVLTPGSKVEITFTVVGADDRPMTGRKALVSLWRVDPANAVTLEVSTSAPTVVTATCHALGSADIRAWDARSYGYGYLDMFTEASALCSASGIKIKPERVTVIADDHTTLQAAVLDANGNEVPLGPGAEFVWHQPFPIVLEVALAPANSALATVGRRADANLFFGPATVQACVGAKFPCDLSAEAQVTIMPDLRGAWSGTGALTAAGCSDPEDNGTYPFSDWLASFTQSVDPGGAPVSSFSATFSGSGVGTRNWGPFSGTLQSSGMMSGAASYTSGDAGGGATFQGGFDVFAPGFESVILDFTYQDAYGDTCSGSGRVTFKR